MLKPSPPVRGKIDELQSKEIITAPANDGFLDLKRRLFARHFNAHFDFCARVHASSAVDSAASNRQISKDTDTGNDIDGTEGTPELNGKPGIFSILHLLPMLHTPNLA
jgi:hypothetical protein